MEQRSPRALRRFVPDGLPKCDGRRHRNRSMKTLLRPEEVVSAGCLNCGRAFGVLPLRGRIAVGLGLAQLERDGRSVWSERCENYGDCMPVKLAAQIAKAHPECDWRIMLHGPLHGEMYRWQNDQWELIKRNKGFA